MSGSTSDSKSASRSKVIPFTDQELELMGINVDQALASFENLDDFGEFQDRLFATVDPVMEQLGFSQTQDLDAKNLFTSEQGFRDRELEEQRSGLLSDLNTELSSLIGQDGTISDADRALLDQLEANSISNVRADTEANLGLLRDNLAPSLGLRSTDTPVLDRGGLVANEGLRLEADVRAARAAQEIDLNSAASSDLNDRIGALGSLGTSIDSSNQFQESLRQQDFDQQLALLGTTSESGLGLSSIKTDSGLQAAIKPIVATDTKSKSHSESGGVGL